MKEDEKLREKEGSTRRKRSGGRTGAEVRLSSSKDTASRNRLFVISIVIILFLGVTIGAVPYSVLEVNHDYGVERLYDSQTHYLHGEDDGEGDAYGERHTNQTMGTEPYDTDLFHPGDSETWTQIPSMEDEFTFSLLYSRLYLEPELGGDMSIDGSEDDRSGWNVTVLDLTNDGHDDLVIGSPFNGTADGSDEETGAVRIYFGENIGEGMGPEDADVTIYGEEAGDRFGWSVGNASDWLGGNGCDLIVGAPGWNQGSGRAYVFKGDDIGTYDGQSASGAEVVIDGENQDDEFGAAVGGRSTLTSSVDKNVFVGAPGAENDRGKVYVYEGGNANEELMIIGKHEGDRFGHSLAGLRSISDAEEWAGLVVGAPYAPAERNTGRAYVFTGDDDPSGVWDLSEENADVTLVGENGGDEFGWSVFSAGDVDDSGYGDIVVGAPGWEGDGYQGRAYVYLGKEDMEVLSIEKTPISSDNPKYVASIESETLKDGDKEERVLEKNITSFDIDNPSTDKTDRGLDDQIKDVSDNFESRGEEKDGQTNRYGFDEEGLRLNKVDAGRERMMVHENLLDSQEFNSKREWPDQYSNKTEGTPSPSNDLNQPSGGWPGTLDWRHIYYDGYDNVNHDSFDIVFTEGYDRNNEYFFQLEMDDLDTVLWNTEWQFYVEMPDYLHVFILYNPDDAADENWYFSWRYYDGTDWNVIWEDYTSEKFNEPHSFYINDDLGYDYRNADDSTGDDDAIAFFVSDDMIQGNPPTAGDTLETYGRTFHAFYGEEDRAPDEGTAPHDVGLEATFQTTPNTNPPQVVVDGTWYNTPVTLNWEREKDYTIYAPDQSDDDEHWVWDYWDHGGSQSQVVNEKFDITFKANFHHLHEVTFKYDNALAQGHSTEIPVTFTSNDTQEIGHATEDGNMYWVDDGSSYSYDDPYIVVENEERWATDDDPDTDGTITGATTIDPKYYHQHYVTFSAIDQLDSDDPIPDITVDYDQFDDNMGTSSDIDFSDWVDCEGDYGYENPYVVGDYERWYSESTNLTGSITESETIAPDYYHQYNISVSTSGDVLSDSYPSSFYWDNMTVQYSTPIYDDNSPIERWMDQGKIFNVSSVDGPDEPRDITYVCDDDEAVAEEPMHHTFLFHTEFPPDVTITGSEEGSEFGWSVSGGADFDDSGADDITIGDPGFDGDKGRTYTLFSDGSWEIGTELWADYQDDVYLDGESPGDRFGHSLAEPGDIYQEDLHFLTIGAPYHSAEESGRTYFYMLGEWPTVYVEFESIDEGITLGHVSIPMEQDVNWYNVTVDTTEDFFTLDSGDGVKMTIELQSDHVHTSATLYYGSDHYDSNYEMSLDTTDVRTNWVKTYRDDEPTEEWLAEYQKGNAVNITANVTSDEGDVDNISSAELTLRSANGTIIEESKEMQFTGESGSDWKRFYYVIDTSGLDEGRYKAVVHSVDEEGSTDRILGETDDKTVWFKVVGS